MHEQIYKIALEAGGSHYPEVGGRLLQTFAELLIHECAKVVDQAIADGGVDGRVLKEHFGISSSRTCIEN